ncbi:hypothetical protein [Dehalogenimonas alkenigignens]|uniref:hypothetical protein n=1 Tax=Dehalogenimonas alkenigignens TaxID=1217799 RepID=UPI000D56CA8A|nr:hypothetical protein [Dehalogenimonas alkenigignens]PVV85000.1 hypothetical protein DD509_01515 [Dehalogenimonas alkenigignens]
MNLADLVQTIFRDESARRDFEANPEAYVTKLELTPVDKKAVLSLHARTGLVTADGVSLQSQIGPMGGWF